MRVLQFSLLIKVQIQLISAIDEKPVINESSTVAGITSIGEIFNSFHEIQRNKGSINIELINLQTVKNPNKVTNKG
ncbi:unnamed protein product [Rhizophagus irregularis]|nr:unnamed protein product [Rhizophagus irregularis]